MIRQYSRRASRCLLLLIGLLFFVQQAAAFEEVGTVCFAFDGDTYVNQTLCPGSNACCEYTATCLSNRLCRNANDAPGTFIRSTCALRGWDQSCAQICLYGMFLSSLTESELFEFCLSLLDHLLTTHLVDR